MTAESKPLPGGGYKAVVQFTLTAQGCGMGQFLKEDIRSKLLEVPAMCAKRLSIWFGIRHGVRAGCRSNAKHQFGIE